MLVAPAPQPLVSGAPLQQGLAVLAAAAAVRPMLPAVGPLCPLRRVTGVPCPACGASAGAVALSRADVGAAFAANPFVLSVFVALIVAACVPLVRQRVVWALRAVGNRPLWFVPVLLVSWLYQLHRYDYV